MEKRKEYYAFISYKREDEKWAKWLQNYLEHYRFPTNLNGRSYLPKNIRPTFRDVTDLTPGLLAEGIDNALRSSEWLIVICSPRSAKSPWVCKEAQTFIDLGRTDKIIPFVIEGNPFSKDSSTECYPEALLQLTGYRELLAANINEMGRDAAAIKVVARMFNLKFDTLWQRYEREQKRKRWMWIGGSIITALLGLSIGGYFFQLNIEIEEQSQHIESQNERLLQDSITMTDYLLQISAQNDSIASQNNLIIGQRDSIAHSMQQLQMLNKLLVEERDNVLKANWQMMENQSRAVAEKAKFLLASGDSYLARTLLSEIMPLNLKIMNRPYTAESEAALRESWQHHDFIIRGHSGTVESACFSKNGKMILSSSMDNTVKLWDASNGRNIKTFCGHDSFVYCAVFSNDNNTIASCSHDKTIKLWDVNSGKLIKTFYGSSEGVVDIAFSPDDKFLVSAAIDTIRVWDVEKGKMLYTMDGSMGFVNTVAFSHDGTKIISAHGNTATYRNNILDNTIKIWDFQTGKQLKTLTGHQDYVYAAYFSPNDKYIISSSWDKTAKIWDAKTGTVLHTLNGHNSMVNHSEFSPNGKMVLTASLDNTIKIWDSKTGKMIKSISSDISDIIYASFSPDGEQVIAAAGDKTIRVWDILPTTVKHEVLTGHKGEVNVVKFVPNSTYAVSASEDGEIIIWNTYSGTIEKKLAGHSDVINSIDCSSNGDYIASASNDNTVVIWDLHTEKKIITLSDHEIGAGCVSFCPDNKTIATADGNGDIAIWEVVTGKVIGVINDAHFLGVDDISFNVDGSLLISSGAFDNTVKVWDVSSRALLHTLNGHTRGVCSVSFSPDGKTAISSSWDHTIRIWDVKLGVLLKTIETGIVSPVYSARFNHDGSKIVSAEMYNTIHIWDTKSGVLLTTLNGHTNGVKYACFSPDDSNVISASDDRTIRIWEFTPLQELIDKTHDRFKGRILTPEERRQYYLE